MTIETRNLGVRHGAVQAVRGVTLRAEAGEVLGIVGPNGSGKSSLMRAIAGLKDCSGSVTVQRGGEALRLAYMPQDLSARTALSVLEVVLLGRLRHLGLQVRSQDLLAVRAVLRELGLESLASRDLGALSGGQRQLVFLAQALAADPQFLLLDEPTSALDIRHQLEVLTMVRRLTRERTLTTLMVLHDLNATARFCDRVALLDGGCLAALGRPAQVLTPALLARVFGVEAIVTEDRDRVLMINPVCALEAFSAP